MTPALHTQGLTKTFTQPFGRNPIHAVADVDLTVVQGEVFGLLGPNGAGKTTLVKMLLGIVHPTRGEARIMGRPAAAPEARARVGFLPENHRFPDFLTADQMLDLYGRLAGVPASTRRTRIPTLLERVGMARWQHTRIKKFSKGMMQRLGLAQALLNEPAVVMLDEPTDGVDPIGRREIRDLLLWLRDAGTTVFLNSHLLSEVEQVCTRVAIMHEGQIVRIGDLATLTAEAAGYELRTTPIPPDLLGPEAPPLTAHDAAPDATGLCRYHLQTTDLALLNQTLDHLRTGGVILETVRPARPTLEDYFIQTIQSERPSSPPQP